MKEQNTFEGQKSETGELGGAFPGKPVPTSGLYERQLKKWPWKRHEQLRLDVDGLYPLMIASGTIMHFIFRTH